jgi:hypothetical protein
MSVSYYEALCISLKGTARKKKKYCNPTNCAVYLSRLLFGIIRSFVFLQ